MFSHLKLKRKMKQKGHKGKEKNSKKRRKMIGEKRRNSS